MDIMHKYIHIKILVLSLAGLVFWGFGVQAAISISLSPIQGGATLRFNRSEVLSQANRELRIRITSTDSDQYQVFQRWVQPLRSSSVGGMQRDFLRFYGLSGSNGSGTLYAQLPDYISMSDQLVYTSSANGASDGFVLIYQVDQSRLESSGQFVGRLLVTVRPIGSGQSQESYLDVFVDADLGFHMMVEGGHGSNLIRLNADQSDTLADKTSFSFEGNAGEIRIYQEMLTPLALVSDNTDLAKGTVFYTTVGLSDWVRVKTPKVLDFNRDLVYRSRELSDSWDIVYEFNSDQTFPLAAGLYRGRIRYTAEGTGILKQFDFDIEIQIDPVFEIILDFPEGKVDFSNLYPGAAPQEQGVIVKVNSNLNKPYMVSQKVLGPLQNEKQEALDQENFLIKTIVDSRSRGKGKMPQFVSVSSSVEQSLYISDEQGSPVEFEVRYRVVPYEEMSPGNYKTEMTYTLGEI